MKLLHLWLNSTGKLRPESDESRPRPDDGAIILLNMWHLVLEQETGERIL